MIRGKSARRVCCRHYRLRDNIGGMRHRVEIHAFEAALVLCAVALVALVYTEGWIWPLKAAAVVLPITLLVS